MIRWCSIALILLVVASCDNTSTQQERERQARDILGDECNLISQITTEVAGEISDKKWVSVVANIGASLACDCIIDKIVPKMTESNSLEEILKLREEPLHLQKEIASLIKANKQEVKSCFQFK